MARLICQGCHKEYPSAGAPFCCPDCGGYYGWEGTPGFEPGKVDPSQTGIWRYGHTFELFEGAPLVTLGEGNTPLVWEPYRGGSVGMKMESLNPTGSYKDRGTAVLVSQLIGRGVREAVEDSSGNAGASFAAYAARAHIKGSVFVPGTASGPKLRQIEGYGAELVSVAGPRSAAAQAVLEEVRGGKVYASHAFMPFGLLGIATIAYELWESGTPGTIIAPAGHGGLLRGILLGFEALQRQGSVNRIPYFVGVQAAACAPLTSAYQNGIAAMDSVSEGATVAEGVRVRWPSQVKALIQAAGSGNGEFMAIAEDEILPAYRELGKRGIYVEPTSALAWCALEKVWERVPKPVVLIISGNGLKYFPPG